MDGIKAIFTWYFRGQQVIKFANTPGGTRPVFGYSWASEDLKPWLCLGQKIHTLHGKTTSTLLPYLGQRTKCTPSFVLKPIGNYKRANSCYSHCFCVLTLGSRGYFFLMDTDGSRRSRVNEAQKSIRKKILWNPGYCVLGVETNFIKQMKSTVEAIPCL